MTKYCWRCGRLVWAEDELPQDAQITHCHRCKAKNVILPAGDPVKNLAPALDRLPRIVLESVVTTA